MAFDDMARIIVRRWPFRDDRDFWCRSRAAFDEQNKAKGCSRHPDYPRLCAHGCGQLCGSAKAIACSASVAASGVLMVVVWLACRAIANATTCNADEITRKMLT